MHLSQDFKAAQTNLGETGSFILAEKLKVTQRGHTWRSEERRNGVKAGSSPLPKHEQHPIREKFQSRFSIRQVLRQPDKVERSTKSSAVEFHLQRRGL